MLFVQTIVERSSKTGRTLSIAAHLSGGLVGVMLGLSVLKNFKKSKKEKIISYVAIVIFVVALILGVVFNAINPIPSCKSSKTT